MCLYSYKCIYAATSVSLKPQMYLYSHKCIYTATSVPILSQVYLYCHKDMYAVFGRWPFVFNSREGWLLYPRASTLTGRRKTRMWADRPRQRRILSIPLHIGFIVTIFVNVVLSTCIVFSLFFWGGGWTQ